MMKDSGVLLQSRNQLAVFLASWIALLIVLHQAHIYTGALVFPFLACVCYVLTVAIWNVRPWYQHLALLVVIFLVSMWPLGLLVSQNTWGGPIGEESDAGFPPCEITPDRIVTNGFGEAAVLRREWCKGGWDPDIFYFVFIHPARDSNNAENLSFRYRPTDEEWDKAKPHVKWVTNSVLEISVAPHGIYQITRQESSTMGVKIIYRIPAPVLKT